MKYKGTKITTVIIVLLSAYIIYSLTTKPENNKVINQVKALTSKVENYKGANSETSGTVQYLASPFVNFLSGKTKGTNNAPDELLTIEETVKYQVRAALIMAKVERSHNECMRKISNLKIDIFNRK